jgi:acid phosphatase type 7
MINIYQRFVLTLLFISIFSSVISQSMDIPARKGWWNFNDTINPTIPVTGFGLPLQLVGIQTVTNGPTESDYAVKMGIGSYYRMTHQISANGGGSYVNEYTLQFDFKVESIGTWRCFFQTTPQNNNDGDCFINPGGNIGVAATGYSPDAISAGEWYRLVISVDNGTSFTYYIDGVPINKAIIQDVDGRFSLDPVLLLFADENGEDDDIIISEISIWDQPLTDEEAASLGGFTHPSPPGVVQFICHPFLQSMTQNSVYVCWHDTLTTLSRVEYGLTPDLGNQADGSSEMVTFPFRWHSVHVTGLTAGTKYYYRLVSGSGNSPVYSFTTMPDDSYNGHIRFLLFSDSQTDSAATGFIVRSAKEKVQELFGEDPDDHINLIMHTGDIVGSGSTISLWTDEFFRPFAPLSSELPFLSVAGNHEGEHRNYYTYIKYDELSAYPSTHPLFEKLWTYRMSQILFIGMNTNVIDTYGDEQIQWLDQTLMAAENDPSISFVFCFLHHPPVSEIWGEGNTAYVSDEVIPVMQKYSKVQQLSYGHTHAFERGVIESKAENSTGDFRISCVGGGGGARDRWGEYTNFDYPQVHIALDHYFYILFDIDLANSSYEAYMYDLGNSNIPATNTIGDQWHRRIFQPAPEPPAVSNPTYTQDGRAVLHASSFEGIDELMSSRFQVSSASGQYNSPLLDQTTNWQDIYGTDEQFQPVDLNEGKDLSMLEVPGGVLETGKKYYYRVRYRDQNLKWSAWSDEMQFNFTGTQGIKSDSNDEEGMLQNIPNPFHESTVIRFSLARNQNIRIEIKDLDGRLIAVPVSGYYPKASYTIPLRLDGITAGIYMCTLITESDTYTIKLGAGI